MKEIMKEIMEEKVELMKLNLQLFSDEGGNPPSNIDEGGVDSSVGVEQSEEGVQSTDVQVGDESTATIPVETEIQEELIPKSAVSKIVSERVNAINKKFENHERYKATIDRLVGMSGLTEDQFYAQLQQIELQEKAQKMGVSPEVAQQIVQSQKALEEANRLTMDMKYQMEEQQLKVNPLYENYESVKDDVRGIASKSGMTLEQAYWALQGPQLLEKQTKLTEQRSIQNQAYKNKRTTVEIEGGDKTPSGIVNLTDSEKAMANKLGLSPEEYAFYNSDDLDYDKIRELKNKKGGK